MKLNKKKITHTEEKQECCPVLRQAWAPWIWKESWVKARKRGSYGNIDLSEQDDGCQWVLRISLINLSAVEYFHRNCGLQIAINNQLLLVGGEDLQKIT